MSIRGAGGGAFGAFIGSACCLLPLLLVSAGVGIAAGLVVFQYRPFFLLLGTLFVVFYILLNLYIKAHVSCSLGEALREERRFVTTTIATFLLLLALVNFLAVPALGGRLAAETGEPGASAIDAAEAGAPEMGCPGCWEELEEVSPDDGAAGAEAGYGKSGTEVST
ncbi:MAG: hypothetical protein GXO66_09345 [Euryarchaeota archaeon]|nr:hypothetical protein [Euryarchaeota archaeon]